MIGSLEGKLELKTNKYIVINVAGIGYRVFVSPETLSKLPQVDETTKLFTAFEVKENAQELYGFLKEEELNFFEILRTVSGVGPKTALSILSLATTKILSSAIINGDSNFLTKVSGIGSKTAQRLIVDLKDKIAELGFKETTGGKKDSDLLEALIKMGYGVKESAEALSLVAVELENEGSRLKEALKILSQNKL